MLNASISGTTLTLQANAAAPPQGLIPVTVTVTAGSSTATVRVPVEIGTLIQQEFARYNALRDNANLKPATLNETYSMNCWLHERYIIENRSFTEPENPALPFATPEGNNCALYNRPDFSQDPKGLTPGAALPLTDDLITDPFSVTNLLNPAITEIGLGSFGTTANTDPFGWTRASSMYIPTTGVMNPPKTPFTFPGNGKTIDLSSSRFWLTDRPTSCPTYIRPPAKVAASGFSGAPSAHRREFCGTGRLIYPSPRCPVASIAHKRRGGESHLRTQAGLSQ
jgi:hypothetical protein